MITKNPKTEVDPNTVLWRYMSFAKFMSLVMDESIYFTRANNFDDGYEGLPYGYMIRIKKMKMKMQKCNVPQKNDLEKQPIEVQNIFAELEKQKKQMQNDIDQLYKKALDFNKKYIVSCWNMEETYSEAMWKIYCPNDDGIAIKTTVGNLEDLMDKNNEFISCGKVNYLKQYPQIVDSEMIFIKRPYFSYEHEFRLAIQDENFNKYPNGKSIKVNLNKLIDEVHIAPLAPSWIKPLVKEILKVKKINKKVVQKHMYEFDIDTFDEDE